MKIAELSIMFIIATFSGLALADQQIEQSSHVRAEIAASGSVVEVDDLDNKADEEKSSMKEQVSNSKSLKELDRERKGLPSYWNG